MIPFTLTSSILFLFSIALEASLQPCQPGFFTTSTGDCRPCPPGTSQSQAGQISCTPCLDTEIAEAGSSRCTPCGVNEIAHTSKRECICKKGAAKRRRSTQCELCPPGTFNERFSGGRSSYCRQCELGYFQSEPGQPRCNACVGNSFSKKNCRACIKCPRGQSLIGKKCGTCPPGAFYKEYRGGCVKCYANTFKPEEGLGPCIPCPGIPRSQRGAVECPSCPPGQAILERDGNTTCGTCPPGTFRSDFGKCTPCPPNSFQPNENIGSACFTCATNAFSKRGATECITCGQDEGLMRNGSCARCKANFFYDRSSFSCIPCSFNHVSTGALYDVLVCHPCRFCPPCIPCTRCPVGTIVREGSGRCEECPTGEAAMSNGECGKCQAGMYYNTNNGICETCFTGIRPVPSIENFCAFCPEGTRENRARTECIPL